MNIFNFLFQNTLFPFNRRSFEKAYKYTIGRFYQNPFNDLMIKRKMVFVHIPKTGGTSIANGLFGKFSGHAYLYEYYLSNKKFANSFYKICVVRNPFDRLVSAYSHLSQKSIRNENKKILEHFNIKSFDDLIKTMDNPKHCLILQNTILMLRPQSEFISYSKSEMDKIYRFENFNEIASHLKGELGIDINLNHLNSSKRGSYRDYYNEYSISVVRKVYKQDLINFKYDY